jgi:pyruvate dehydrogenase complex dehydrogenase (E1) component
MAQGILAALTGGEQTTLATAVTAIHDAAAAVIALGYPAYAAYDATYEKEILFYDKLQQIHDLSVQLGTAVTAPATLKRESC